MNSLQFKKSQLKYLCSKVGFDVKTVEFVLENIDSFCYEKPPELKPDKKNGGFKKYKDGTLKVRIIRPSKGKLKIIQKNIKSNILANIALPDNVHGGVRKRSNISNAKPHQGKKYQFTTDLQNFYPSIKSKHVYDCFLELGFSNYFASFLTKLTTWKGEVPQGAPTSTVISNLVFLKTDIELINFCNDNGITYTRYIDDLTFSSHKDFRTLIPQLMEIVAKRAFRVSYRKTLYAGNQNVTGIDVFLNRIDVPEKIKEKANDEKYKNLDFNPVDNYIVQVQKTNVKKKKNKIKT
ncbi:reverse transcriptase family protein [Flavobacterium anhuiense]|uniref:reverse transcriptase family protein n=1 Tax=Flavobacterium anhuiense TaxID=459526 RepID=UPI000E6CF1C7|nr:reverse transcriptase family protein [Flavobacterium anhuiense]